MPGEEVALSWFPFALSRSLVAALGLDVLAPLVEGRTRFVQSERFSGVVVRMLAGTLEKTRLGFHEMNQALRAEVEARRAVAA